MNPNTNRLLMELEHTMRSVNREVINPQIQALTVDGLRPVLALVARARGRYIRALLDLGGRSPDEGPSEEELQELARLRHEFEELMHAAKTVETAIQRGYLDIQPSGR